MIIVVANYVITLLLCEGWDQVENTHIMSYKRRNMIPILQYLMKTASEFALFCLREIHPDDVSS